MAGRILHSVALNLEPAQFLAGWRPETATLFLSAVSEGRVGDEVAVRLGIFGQTIRATMFGTIALVRRVGRPSLPPGVELKLDQISLPAARFLSLAASGEKVSFRERAPRYIIERPLRFTRAAVEQDASTANVSEGGCAVVWKGAMPMVGEVLSVRMGDGLFPASGRAVVCWNSLDGSPQRCVGLRLIAEGRAAKAWRQFTGNAKRSGARTA
jgi:hypothetical protein